MRILVDIFVDIVQGFNRNNMLQPRSTTAVLLLAFLLVADTITGDQNINSSPRKRRQDGEDVTTVLLVDSHGRSTFGRFLSVKPDLGLLTSTARTFIQEGVTTEYATQVLGTTLDNGRLYAHLLTKSSRVVYDKDAPTRTHESPKKWVVDGNLIGKANFVKNTDYISPNQVDNPFVVFPTIKPQQFETNRIEKKEISEEELLSEPSNNPRVPFVSENGKQNNVKVFQINPHAKNIEVRNYKEDSAENDVIQKDEIIAASKVREWDNLPTFTVRNEFSPSGFSFLGDLPDFDVNTERTKQTTTAERRAKLLFRGGIPNKQDLKTVTYTGFADFTTTVGDTVIVFSPQTVEASKQSEASIKPTKSLNEPPIATKIKTFLNHEPGVVTETVEGHKLSMQTTLPTMVVEPANRKPKQETFKEPTPELDALKMKVGSTIIFASDTIEPSESQIPMLSTPSDEDIAKIFASLQAKAAQQATEPLNTPSTKIFEASTHSQPRAFGGATTIFFEDEPIQNTAMPTTTIKEEPTTTESEEELEKQTTEHIYVTTQREDPTTNEIPKEDITTEHLPETTTLQEEEKPETDVKCTEGLQIVPTTAYRTLTYLTTFFIPNEDDTSTSVKSNQVISTEIGFQTRECQIDPSNTQTTIKPSELPTTTQSVPEEETTQPIITTTELEPTTEQLTTTEQQITTEPIETTPSEITTERRHVTESEPETTEMTTENGEEIELLFKTLYTTYTYLTTYFQDSSSSVASRKQVITNVITSTLDPSTQMTDDPVAGLVGREFKSKPVTFEDFAEIAPTGVGIGRPTTLPDLNENSEQAEHVLEGPKATPALPEENLQQTVNAVKTYYTTYTYFTTIFVDGETEISSRTEVYTNYVTPTETLKDIFPTKLANEEEEEVKNKIMALNMAPGNTYNSTINRQKSDIYDLASDKLDNNIVATAAKGPSYNTLQRSTTESSENELLDLSDYETISTMVTDVRSSTSEGDRRIIDNVDKRNVLLDDQIVSESNNDSEILASPTLLLQTSYTTFTYFTTMYQGTTASNIVSRLETITNVVTQTLTPTHTLSAEDLSLPITYFTTFTYWTTLYKDGTTKVTSREETVSNIVTPTPIAVSAPPTIRIEPTVVDTQIKPTLEPSKASETDDLTTYYTTYTYFTTSYVGNSTVLNSRLETVTNVLNKTADIESNQINTQTNDNQIDSTATASKEEVSVKPTGLLSTIKSTVENDGTQTILATDVFGTYIDGLYAKVLESTTIVVTPTVAPSAVQEKLKPTGIVSINEGRIVDADSISTLLYTTKAVGTYIDNLYAQVIESTSTLKIDEEKKALITEPPAAHRTGLVRLIEGSIIHSQTTTFYQSKVLGTVIDGRYAQIIESTSSFKVEPTVTVSDINPSPTQSPGQISATVAPITPSPVVIEGSISDSTKTDEENSTEIDEDDENSTEDGDGTGRVKSRLTFQSRKRTFTPIIRPFASRSKPTFAPKRKGSKPSATTITRSDFTPTVTAIPATKSGGRFGGRKSSTPASITPSASGSRRFSRPRSSTTPAAGFASSTRGRSTARIQPTATGFGSSTRRGGFRSSIQPTAAPRPSSVFNQNNRFRIRPTATLSRGLNSNAVTQPSTVSDDENDITTAVTEASEGEGETVGTTTTETSRRNQNPLLRFRRPPLSRPATTPKTATTRNNSAGSTRGSRNGNRPTTTTPTPKARTTFSRPNAIQNRARPANALFPRRNLFTTTTTTQEPEEAEEEENEEVDEAENEENGEEDDTEFEGSNTHTETTPVEQNRKSRAFNPVQIKPFASLRKRTKRQTTYSRFRRPGSRTTSTLPPEEPETEPPRTTRRGYVPRSRSRVDSYTTNSPPRITPSRASLPGRSQFTLRDSSANSRSSNFRRPSTQSSNIRKPTPRPSSRLRTQTESNNSNNSNRKTSRSRGKSTRRGSSRHKSNSAEIESNYVLPGSDGTITVTHQIPTEVTIPVVNGKVTEYKNIVTAKLSTEILGPKQYSTTINPYGKDITVLLSESTGFAGNGAKQVTKYTLIETPTTTVIFTPTYIRGRKTSFSHVIPSTVYVVDPVVNTIAPSLPQAPLANILLSQLLLGNQQPNPLLGLQNAAPVVQGSPTTELKTRTTTYVTTVTNEMSTVIPLTFRGKEILTTIVESTVNVITATEFLTDTVVVTPTPVVPQNNQLNSLLVPLLLQQQQQQNLNPIFQSPAGVLNTNEELFKQSLFESDKQNLAIDDIEEDEDYQSVDRITEAPKRKNRNKNKKPALAPAQPVVETSVITLYVSGRTPGEFSTVLSTVVVGEENKRKREATYSTVEPSKIFDDLIISTLGYVDSYVMPAVKEGEDLEPAVATESLESFLGDVSKQIVTDSPMVKPTKPGSLASKKYKFKYEKAMSSGKPGNFLA